MRPLQLFGILSAVILLACSAKDSQESDLQMREETTEDRVADMTPPTLDGKTFVVDFREAGSEESAKDTLSFMEGNFHSIACDHYGFGAATYTATADGESLAYSTTTTSEVEGAMAWTGHVTGERIEGEVTWTKEGQDPILYEYSGTVQ